MTDLATLFQGSKEIPFSALEEMLAGGRDPVEARPAPKPRASTATVVVVGKAARIASAGEALAGLGSARGVRTILIVEGTSATPQVRVTESLVVIDGLAPKYLNNAVAAVRLPSLPALIWWRGGSQKALEDVTRLADRLVLDIEDPGPVWKRVDRLVQQTALTDLRWTRLTRWRSMLAHIFDLPQVRAATGAFRRLVVQGQDRPSSRLFAAWFVWCDPNTRIDVQIETVAGDGRSPLESVQLVGDRVSIGIRRIPGRDCLEASLDGDIADVRIAPLGHTTLADCIGEELAVRSRDVAFEGAIAALATLQEVK
jgi:glucose-6-phosphate dehydrogenase assembly protein OpcA